MKHKSNSAEKRYMRVEVLGCGMEPERMGITQVIESILSWAEKHYCTTEAGKLLPWAKSSPLRMLCIFLNT